jgi:lipopolysaccharide export system protein LptA
MHRLIHSAISLAIVAAAYMIYALAAVPFIEPSIAGPSDGPVVEGIAVPGSDQSFKLLEGLFTPEGRANLKNPKILENNKVKLLFEKYTNFNDGSVELKPCIMVFPWDGPAEDEIQRLRQSVILEASTAILKFNEPINLTRLKMGRLEGGTLKGPIVIHSQGKSPGPEDDLLILTNDVQLNEREAWTENPVKFTWGKNYGSGQDMHIKLLSDPSKPNNDINAPSLTVEIFEMRRIERLHIESPPRSPAVQPPAAKQTGGLMSPSAMADQPVEITCEGAFTFNVNKRVATFDNNVDVVRLNPNGPSDHIQCQLLSMYFVARDSAGADADNASDLEPERLEARGHPVIINAPTQNVTGQGDRLEYNIKTNLISLSTDNVSPEVFLNQGPNEIHGRSLQYQSLGNNRLGRAAAKGPGWLRGNLADKPDQRFEARWNDQLRLFPQGENHVISFTGGATLDYAGIGHMEAKEIFFWIKETQQGGTPDKPRIVPDRMLARNQVLLSAPRFSAEVQQQMEVWFEQKESPQSVPQTNEGSGQATAGQGIYSPNTAAAQDGAAQSHFKITGGKLQARVQLQDQQAASLADILIEDNVRLEETQKSRPKEMPVLIQGDRLHGTNVTAPTAVLCITGRPAHFEAHGLGLTGTNINLNRGSNNLWIDGPGRMDLLDIPLSSNMLGQSPTGGEPAATSGTLVIEWAKNMLFDGKSAKFEKTVSAATPQLHLQTETLEVTLKNPINFSNPNMQNQGQPGLEELQCYGGAFLENRTFDPQQQLSSYDRIKIDGDLGVNLLSGALTAGGPGWLNRVNIGSANAGQNPVGAGLLGGRPSAPAQNNRAAIPVQPLNELNCLHVRFHGSITGNILKRKLTFNDQIRAVYGPVLDWNATLDPDKPENLPPQAITLGCKQLNINQLLLPSGKGQSIEAEALGNAVAEGGGGMYTARAQRIIYVEAKDLLYLEGDGLSDAELFRQAQPGAKTTRVPAQKFEYNIKTNAIKIINARSAEIILGK